jgi:hypothetical protein
MQYQLLTFQSGGKSYVGLLLHEHSSNSFAPLLAKDLGTLLRTANWHTASLGLVSIQILVLPNFFSVNT